MSIFFNKGKKILNSFWFKIMDWKIGKFALRSFILKCKKALQFSVKSSVSAKIQAL